VVLLGASNLTKGLRGLVAMTRETIETAPLEILVAAGHGRSYGQWSRVLARGLPGILQCGLWPVAARSGAVPTYALLTDIGNDLAYGTSPAELIGWLATCLARLRAIEAFTVMTFLPTTRLAQLTPWHFRFFRSVFFPGCGLSYQELLARAVEVNERLADLADRHRAAVVVPRPHWFGADPIHLRRSERPAAWREILSRWDRGANPPACSPTDSARDATARAPLPRRPLAPAHCTVLGMSVCRPQPSAVLRDGSTISLF
jgi:hypothetical protein